MKAHHIKLRRLPLNAGGKPYWVITYLWPASGTIKMVFDHFDGAIAYLLLLELGGCIMIKLYYFVGQYEFELVCYNLSDLIFALNAIIAEHYSAHEVTEDQINNLFETACINAVEVFNGGLLSYSTFVYKIERITEA